MKFLLSPKSCYFIIILVMIFSVSCKQKEKSKNEATEVKELAEVIEVTTIGMEFQLVNEIESGWTTFKYINKSEEPHFFILEKMPDSIRIDDYKNELFPPFMAAFKLFDEGDMEAGMKEFEKIPQWFYKVELGGGVGLVSPHTEAMSTLYLDPGVYVMECYVRMPNGQAHAFMGMVKELVVTENNNGQKEPIADYQISLSSETGVQFVDSLKAGTYTLGVTFNDQKLYEHMLGHDVNLVKLDKGAELDTLGGWLNTMDIKAFRTPAPEGYTFMGGVEDLKAQRTGYFTTSLTEGDYVLISEIPNTLERNMFKRFTVHKN